MFIKPIFKNSGKVKRIRNYVSNCNLYLYFLVFPVLFAIQNLLISGEEMLMSAELKGCFTWFIYFLDLPLVRCNCQVLSLQDMGDRFYGGRAFLPPPPPPPHPWGAPKKAILNRVKTTCYHYVTVILPSCYQTISVFFSKFQHSTLSYRRFLS